MENNINLSGTEARMLMAALMTSSANAPMGDTLKLYIKLAAISNVQPAEQ
jgi:hypothetical protein